MYCNKWGEFYVHAQLYVVLHVHATTPLKNKVFLFCAAIMKMHVHVGDFICK